MKGSEKMPKEMSDWEKRVRKALIDKDMHISDLADELNVSSAYVYDVLSGNRKATGLRQRINDLLKLDGG